TPAAARASSQIADVQDFVFAYAGGRLDLDDIALALADERAGHRAGDRNEVRTDIGFDVPDDLVGDAFAGFQVLDFDGGAKDGLAVQVEGGWVDDLRVRQRAFEFEDAALDKGLALAGGVVFGVLGQIALGACLGDGIDDFGPVDGLQ